MVKKKFPWYDSTWLSYYIAAQELIKNVCPEKLDFFIAGFEPLKTREDFDVIKLSNFLRRDTLDAFRELITDLPNSQKEAHEIFKFGRLVVHNHEFFNGFQRSITDQISELVQEELEPTYNFLSLYKDLGFCKVHMDSPEAKYTVDICIEQSDDWPIFIAQRRDWPVDFETTGEDWSEQIIKDPHNKFTQYSLEPGGGVIFSGTSQWHYREPIARKKKKNFCNLIFFHFIPKGTRDLVYVDLWADFFDIPELSQLLSLKTIEIQSLDGGRQS